MRHDVSGLVATCLWQISRVSGGPLAGEDQPFEAILPSVGPLACAMFVILSGVFGCEEPRRDALQVLSSASQRLARCVDKRGDGMKCVNTEFDIAEAEGGARPITVRDISDPWGRHVRLYVQRSCGNGGIVYQFVSMGPDNLVGGSDDVFHRPVVAGDCSSENFVNFEFGGAVCNKCRLERADMTGSRMDGVRFVEAVLVEARLDEASLSHASLTSSRLRAASFARADATATTFVGSDLREAVFHSAALRRAHFFDTNLEGVDFSGADLREALFARRSADSETNASSVPDMRDVRWYGAVCPDGRVIASTGGTCALHL